MNNKLKASSYTLGAETWTITERTLVTEKVYVPPLVDEDTGNYLDWGSYQDVSLRYKAVWKETTSKPFVF